MSETKTTHTPGLDKLKELHAQLGNLLEDPHPGLFTWRLMLSDNLMEIAGFAGHGDISKKMELMDEMLEALQCFLRTWKSAGPQGSHQFEKFDTAVRLAEIAIAKATGEQ